MKILFICGSLELGRDGVGDYTRRLAAECSSRGHECAIIALHEYGLTEASLETGPAGSLLRLPARSRWEQRLERAVAFHEEFGADWVSWQLVTYGIDPRGLVPSALMRHAARLNGPNCHVMAHELWLGLETTSSWRARAIGWQQRRDVLNLLDRLNPSCMHTSNSTYQVALAEAGYSVALLGLFGNVPVSQRIGVAANPLAPWLPPNLRVGTTQQLVAVTFGTLHSQWEASATAKWLNQTALRHYKQPVLIAIGRVGAHATATFNAFGREEIPVVVTGEQSTDAVSELLGAADFGIAPHPWALIGKSGAAAAMIDHGLPVLVPRDDWLLRGKRPLLRAALDPLLKQLAGLDPIRTDLWLASKRRPASVLPQSTETFLAALAGSSALMPTLS